MLCKGENILTGIFNIFVFILCTLFLALMTEGDMKVSVLQNGHIMARGSDNGISSCSTSHAESALQSYSTAQQALRTPVAPTAVRTTAILSVALEHRTKYHVAWRGLIRLHKLWLCRNFMCYEMGSECALQEKRKCRRLESPAL